jgi:hypothetical protein
MDGTSDSGEITGWLEQRAQGDPAVVAFEAQLANVGGPFITTSDTGFQTQPFSLAYCEYVNALLGITTPCVPGPPGTSQYEFTYQLGPYLNSGNTYESFVNFQIYSRDVTEQLLATPEPGMVVPLGVGFVAVGILRRKRTKRAGWTPTHARNTT